MKCGSKRVYSDVLNVHGVVLGSPQKQCAEHNLVFVKSFKINTNIHGQKKSLWEDTQPTCQESLGLFT